MRRNPEENSDLVVWDRKCLYCGRTIGQTPLESEQLLGVCPACKEILREANASKDRQKELDREFLRSIGVLP